MSASAAEPGPPPCPAGAIALFGGGFDLDPDGTYQQLRAHGPVTPVRLTADAWGWLVIGDHEVQQVLANADGAWTSDSRRWHGWPLSGSPLPGPLRDMTHRLSSRFSDGPSRSRLATPLEQALAELDPQTTVHYLARIADEDIETFAGQGAADLVSEYAHRLSPRVMMGLLGMTERYAAGISVALDNLTAPEHADRGHRRLTELLLQLVREKRAIPGPDLVSWIITHGPDLSDTEVGEQARLLMSAGISTTNGLLRSALAALLTDAGLRRAVQQGYRSIADVTTQVLAKTPPLSEIFGRVATRPTRMGNTDIAAGDLVIISLAGAAADPSTAGRAVDATTAWGVGEHRCPPAARDLALMIVHTSVMRLLHHLPDITLALPTDQLAWSTKNGIRSVDALPVQFQRVRQMLVDGEVTFLPPATFTTTPAPLDVAQASKPAPDRPDAQALLNGLLEGYLVTDKPYPSPLPAELADWHGYTRYGGHIILVVLDDGELADHPSRPDLEANLFPAAVRTVLREGWRLVDGFVVCKLPIDPWNGVVTPETDFER
ncbi:hypothetical protein ACIP98_41165 [Streptomyces sp. NPDC088354]|uniref:hypothetical protein n=1 Tax=Streptomyces sp. NPDC088354 TaxID=3365856 RepID=UPI0038290FE8